MKKLLPLLFIAYALCNARLDAQTIAVESRAEWKLNTAAQLTIKNIRWGSQNDPLNGLTVTWENTGLTDSIKWGYTTGFEQGTIAATRRNANLAGNYFFRYVFASVQAKSTIHYMLYDSKSNAWSSEYTFNTAPAVNTTNFRFLGVGDSRDNMTVWNKISSAALSRNADFSIYNGDIVADGSNNSLWNSWFAAGDQFLSNTLIYHSMGNHDAIGTPQYQNTFDLPQNSGSNLYYSFKYGNALFICINTENPSNTAQYNWLVSTLQANQSATWKIVFFHRPFYTIGNHAGEMNGYFNTIWKAFDDYGVDLICNGHDHMYERTKPINRNVSTTAPVATYGSKPGQGRCEIVCGGAGAPLYTGTPTVFIEKYQSKYNFVEFSVNGNTLHGTAYDETNAILDTFTIVKSTVGVEDYNQKFNPIEIYPNPAKNSVVLKSQSTQKGAGLVRIVDLNGAVVREDKIIKADTDFEYKMDNIQIPAGAYFVELTVNGQKDTVMLMVKK